MNKYLQYDHMHFNFFNFGIHKYWRLQPHLIQSVLAFLTSPILLP